MLVQTPTYVLMNTSRVTGDNLTKTDYAFAGIMLTAIATSAVADQQQWSECCKTQTYTHTDTNNL